ncbi:Helix-loop-helix DNA-binding protein [Akanthomyces lecanii RCEF 1005]|uniref:Helix-loop-helix DNA-binding protein n=1 Tax=Akanthomyces lecanii RCEF 1005 TaxID=1081108 RepID=A0A167UHM7_CORDF|nr:Helix-loop-helix DNA-binding protein [Akanthomyces lecanii RCEF 1005]
MKAMNGSTLEDAGARNSTGDGEQTLNSTQSQLYGYGASWKNDNTSMPMHSVQQFAQHQTTDGSWKQAVLHQQQLQQSHQQLNPDAILGLPCGWSLTACNMPHRLGDCLMVNETAHCDGPPKACGLQIAATHHYGPSTVAGWAKSASHCPDADIGAANMRSSSSSSRGAGTTGCGQEIKPVMLTYAVSSLPKEGPLLQSAAATKSERAKGRATHNDVERKYRTSLKDGIAKLQAAVPALQAHQDVKSDSMISHAAPKVSKSTILRKATEYIQQLERANQAMASERAQAMERLQTLEAMLQNGAASSLQYAPNHGMTMFGPRGGLLTGCQSGA